MRLNCLIIVVLLLYSFALSQSNNSFSPASYVNPFIGTDNDGNTYPGAVAPWGMVSVSPHNTYNKPSGYVFGEKYFYGFGHVHLSGVGCNELGCVLITAVNSDTVYSPEDYKTIYSDEKASPGYYSVYLNNIGIRAEATAAARCGLLRFVPDTTGILNILIDAGKNLRYTGGGRINILSDTELEGYVISGGFCGDTNSEKIFFYTRFDRPFLSADIRKNGIKAGNKMVETVDTSLICNIAFNIRKGESILVKTGISYVSSVNAKNNLLSEVGELSFKQVRSNTEKTWNVNLSRVYVEGGSNKDYVKFYSALYHMLIHPNIISDVNGEYPLMGGKGVGKYENRNRYSVFSLWDTYRTLHPFLTLVFPERQSEIIKTMLDMYSESGYLPKWELAGNETYVMVGDPAAAVIADSYVKGVTDFDFNFASDAVLAPSMLKAGEPAPRIRAGYNELLQYGYIPFEQERDKKWWVWGPVSTTLEYNLADWCISQMFKKAGRKELSDVFYNRSLMYKNLFDSKSLFIRPKLKSGAWMEPFDPLLTEGAGDWGGSGGPGYVEGNAWNYTWFVPHDIPGLIRLFGGEKLFFDKLLECFNNKQFTITNEPDIAYPYLFNYVKGEEYRTREFVEKIINGNYNTGPAGLPGNDDCGTTSGWLVFSMLGFYPDCPASEYYQAGVPSFTKSIISLNKKYYPGNSITIEKSGTSGKNCTVLINGKKYSDFKIYHKDIISGGVINFIIK
jgi:predicted alpha-1,2-mannosidase